MAPSVEEVEKMHHDLRENALPLPTKRSERVKAEKYRFTDEEIKPYFPLERVLDGLFSLTSRLFGVEIEAADGQAEVWNPDPHGTFREVEAEISGHFKTGEPLPDELFEKLKVAHNCMVATGMSRQLGFGALDMRLCGRLLQWVEILSCDAYGAFEEAAKESPEAQARVGRKFRDTILARGGDAVDAASAITEARDQVSDETDAPDVEEDQGRKHSMVPLLTQYGLVDK
eukprot:jgi/Phyca11/16154/fgenesh1_pg.PHYCAscaffold_18_\